MHIGRRVPIALLFGCAAISTGGCKRSEPIAAEKEKLVVFAATSLREAFTTMGETFKRSHSEVELVFNFAGTQELRLQIEQGASADVFASADQRHMAELLRVGRVQTQAVFARNEPVVVVAQESAATIREFADLAKATRIVIGAAEVPIGRYTAQILDRASAKFGADFRARIESKVVSRELNVRQVLAKVTLGEADAGIVYRTDALSNKDRIPVVAIPSDINVIAEYPIAVVSSPTLSKLARTWVDFVLSVEGQKSLRSVGFLAPSGPDSRP